MAIEKGVGDFGVMYLSERKSYVSLENDLKYHYNYVNNDLPRIAISKFDTPCWS